MIAALAGIGLFKLNSNPVQDAVSRVAAWAGLTPSGVRQITPTSPEVILDFKAQGIFASIDISREETPASLDFSKSVLENGSAGKIAQVQPSGVPLGDFCFVSAGGTLIRCGGQGVYVSALLGCSGDAATRERYKRVLEALARIAFAEAIGADATETTPGTTNGLGRKASAAGRVVYRSLTNMGGEKGTITQVGDFGDRIRMRLGNRLVEFALGSDVAMFGRGRVELSGFVARKDGVWLFPAGALSSTLGLSE